LKEDWYSTACVHADGSTTEIRVHIRPEARRAAEEVTGDSGEMIKRCVWRLIGLKHESNEVRGDSVEFVIDEPKMLELLDLVRKVDLANRQVCRTFNKLDAKS
jgi:hypothetical protein